VVLRAVGCLLLSAMVAACADAAPSTPQPRATVTVTGKATSLPAVTSRPTGGPASQVRVDASLLDLLPADVDGVPVEFSGEAAAEVAGDSSVADAEAIAYGIAVDPEDEQLLIVAVARLREGVFGDGFFRGWREAYDREVCAQVGGVAAGAVQAEIDGRNVFIGSCVNGGTTYHVWLEARRSIVSAVSFGDRRLGERLVEDLRE